MWFEGHPAPNCPSSLRTESSKEAATAEGLDLEEPLELGLEVVSFLKGSTGSSEDKDDRMPPEPAVTEFIQWVLWMADRCKTPSWWAELSALLEVEDHKRLVREVQASFWLPQRMRELQMEEADLQAPLHHQAFVGRSLCCLPYPSMPAGTLEKSTKRKW